jgi:hypothetical protein
MVSMLLRRASLGALLGGVLVLAGCQAEGAAENAAAADDGEPASACYDRGRNGLWLQHGWLGHDSWFDRHRKSHLTDRFRDPERVRELRTEVLEPLHVTDVFPHLAPTDLDGAIRPVDPEQARRFLDNLEGIRVMPWVGGVQGKQVTLGDSQWRRTFVASIRALLTEHPRLAGVHLNIEPCPSGDPLYLTLLDEVRAGLPDGKLLSIAAFPPPTWWHPFSSVHWSKDYYREVSRRVDQLVVMMYDTGLSLPWAYRWLLASWTGEILAWAAPAAVLLGLPAYEDRGMPRHDPDVENLDHALRGVREGLAGLGTVPAHFQGVAVYAEWELDEAKRATLGREFLCARRETATLR